MLSAEIKGHVTVVVHIEGVEGVTKEVDGEAHRHQTCIQIVVTGKVELIETGPDRVALTVAIKAELIPVQVEEIYSANTSRMKSTVAFVAVPSPLIASLGSVSKLTGYCFSCWSNFNTITCLFLNPDAPAAGA